MKNRVKELRISGGITQVDMAEKLGVSRQTVISIEKERYKPSIVLAFKLAKLFNTSIEDIFTMEDGD